MTTNIGETPGSIPRDEMKDAIKQERGQKTKNV